MNYKGRFFTEDEIIAIIEGLCITIEEHGWKCDDGHYPVSYTHLVFLTFQVYYIKFFILYQRKNAE